MRQLQQQSLGCFRLEVAEAVRTDYPKLPSLAKSKNNKIQLIKTINKGKNKEYKKNQKEQKKPMLLYLHEQGFCVLQKPSLHLTHLHVSLVPILPYTKYKQSIIAWGLKSRSCVIIAQPKEGVYIHKYRYR